MPERLGGRATRPPPSRGRCGPRRRRMSARCTARAAERRSRAALGLARRRDALSRRRRAPAGAACRDRRRGRVPLIAVNDVLYHAPERRALQDVVTCIREHLTLETAGRRLEANAERHLKTAAEMARLFREAPEAIGETVRFLESCRSRSMNCAAPNTPTNARRLRHAAGGAGRLRRGGAAAPLSRRRAAEGAPCARRGTATDRRTRLCAVFSHRGRDRQVRALAERRSCARAAARRPIP